MYLSDIYAIRMDANGSSVWIGGDIAVTNSGSSKTDMMICKGQGCIFIAWTENGNVYAHCLKEDGTLGAPDNSVQGDVNGDGLINILDIIIFLEWILGWTEPTASTIIIENVSIYGGSFEEAVWDDDMSYCILITNGGSLIRQENSLFLLSMMMFGISVKN